MLPFVDAAQSFGIPGIVGVRSILDLHVPGPGTLTFWWKVSNNPTGIYDLRFLVYGGLQAVIKGEVDWQQVTVTIPAATYAYYQVQWVYDSGFDGPWSNCGWVDQVQFVPASSPTNPPTNCTISISPGSRAHEYAGGTGIVAVATQTGCAWSVVTTNSWISILSSLNNSNSGTVIYSLAPNTNSQARSGQVLIGGQGFLLTQFGTSSATNAPRLQIVSQTPTNTALSVQGHAGSMYVVECSTDLVHWTPISTNSAPSLVTDAPVADTPRRFYRTVEIP